MDRTALFIIDVQKGEAYSQHSGLVKEIEALQKLYQHICVFQFINGHGSPWEKWMAWTKYKKGDNESELAFKPEKTATLMEKNSYTCISQESLGWLDVRGIEEVHITGFRTENCVLATAVDLFQTNLYRPVVLADYCSSKHADLHEAGLKILEKFIGLKQIVYGKRP